MFPSHSHTHSGGRICMHTYRRVHMCHSHGSSRQAEGEKGPEVRLFNNFFTRANLSGRHLLRPEQSPALIPVAANNSISILFL